MVGSLNVRLMAQAQLPNLIIIGAMKSGTTSLHYYLNQHPEVYMSKLKELWFFNTKKNWHEGLDWYKSHFKTDALVRGEASPGYTMYPRRAGVAKRMFQLLPEAKLVYIVREPTKRILSEYLHKYTGGLEDRILDEVLNCPQTYPKYLAKSKYFFQLQQYLKFYPASQIYVLTTTELRNHQSTTLRDLFHFLGVDDQFTCAQFRKIKNPSHSKRRLNPIGRKIYHLLAEKHLNPFQPNIQRALIKKIIFPFTTKVEMPTLSDFWKEKIKADVKEDVTQLRQFTGKSLNYWNI